jgi:hypothetical protein
MDDDDTLILTPEDKEKILKDIPDEENQDEENKED